MFPGIKLSYAPLKPFAIPVAYARRRVASGFRVLACTPLILYFLSQAMQMTTGDDALDYLTGAGCFVILLKWIDFMILHTPEKDFRRVGRAEGSFVGGEGVEERVPETFLEKLLWSCDLWTTLRGIGWNWQVPNVPGTPASKWSFVKQRIVACALYYIFLDIPATYVRRLRLGQAGASDIFDYPLKDQVVLTWLSTLCAYTVLQLQYNLFACIFVATGLSAPDKWPPVMGSLPDHMGSVRSIWAGFWHQTVRRVCTRGPHFP
ncbi:hypothetical protein BP5796_09129 [Coleophoma crateriformis]|uniref:Wax synthase domain-containing protein n=1 Tax=Coleophoma crateriformis TaxID=565419 RepID=A0A3D8R346_9HELO|nr:hypothetical protein BP5796_09129 [Coleophoma crateriformis]